VAGSTWFTEPSAEPVLAVETDACASPARVAGWDEPPCPEPPWTGAVSRTTVPAAPTVVVTAAVGAWLAGAAPVLVLPRETVAVTGAADVTPDAAVLAAWTVLPAVAASPVVAEATPEPPVRAWTVPCTVCPAAVTVCPAEAAADVTPDAAVPAAWTAFCAVCPAPVTMVVTAVVGAWPT
jgi:hypothetical protein